MVCYVCDGIMIYDITDGAITSMRISLAPLEYCKNIWSVLIIKFSCIRRYDNFDLIFVLSTPVY